MQTQTENNILPNTSGDDELEDCQIIQLILEGNSALFELIMRRYNQRLYRVIRGVLGSDTDVEDIIQNSYIQAYTHLDQYRAEAKFSTWLTRIALYKALRHRKGKSRMNFTNSIDRIDDSFENNDNRCPPPDRDIELSELRATLTDAIDRLPDSLRPVVMLRDIEQMDTKDTAECLNISEGNVRIKLHRGHESLRHDLDSRFGKEFKNLYTFGNHRCDKIVENVFKKIKLM